MRRFSESDVKESGTRSGANELAIPFRVDDDAPPDATKRVVQPPLVPVTKKPAPAVHGAGIGDAGGPKIRQVRQRNKCWCIHMYLFGFCSHQIALTCRL